MRTLLAVLALAVTLPLSAQAVPEGSQSDRIESGWLRVPSLRFDPFRHAFVPHWGFVFTAGGFGENNVFSAADVGALLYLDDNDDIRITDMIDALGLIPRGAGAGGTGGADASFYLGGPIGPLSIALSAGGRGYGAFQLDDRAVALLRDGNGAVNEFSLGASRGIALGTAEYGAHATMRLGPFGGVDGARLTLGAGARIVRAVFYGRGRSTIANGGRLLISGDSVLANIGVEVLATPVDDGSAVTDAIFSGTRGSGVAADFVARLAWPTNGLAFEAMLANLGSITVQEVERQSLTVNIAATTLDTVLDVLDTLDLTVQDTISVDVTLPRIVRFGASAWANRILQLSATATMPVSGDFEQSMVAELGTTWRFVRTLPLRVGVLIGRTQGLGYTAGFGIEGRNFLLRFNGQSLGGFMRNAKGVGAQFVFGIFF